MSHEARDLSIDRQVYSGRDFDLCWRPRLAMPGIAGQVPASGARERSVHETTKAAAAGPGGFLSRPEGAQ